MLARAAEPRDQRSNDLVLSNACRFCSKAASEMPGCYSTVGRFVCSKQELGNSVKTLNALGNDPKLSIHSPNSVAPLHTLPAKVRERKNLRLRATAA